MKILPRCTSDEIFLDIDYVICRFMKSKIAYKTNQNQPGTLFTIKKVQEKGIHPQYHFHMRFDGKDKIFNKEDIIDLDFYITEKQFTKLLSLVKNPNQSRLIG